MTEILALFLGVLIGVAVMAVLSADTYEKGAADERAKFWQSVRRDR